MMATAMNAVVNLIGVRLMRLIDADALISFIDPEHLRHSGELTFSEVDVINMLNHAPTAFDVEELRSNSETTSKWIPISERLPESDEYILISCSNYTGLCIGRYEKHEDGSGNFYQGDDDDALLSYGLFVNAWMPLPKPYREVDDE